MKSSVRSDIRGLKTSYSLLASENPHKSPKNKIPISFTLAATLFVPNLVVSEDASNLDRFDIHSIVTYSQYGLLGPLLGENAFWKQIGAISIFY